MKEALSYEQLDRVLGKRAPFLLSLSDGEEETLRLVIAAAELGESGSETAAFEDGGDRIGRALGEILTGARPITPSESSRFEICFHDYILYLTRSGSYCSGDPREVRCGNWLVTYESSALLTHLEEITDARQLADGSFYPGRWVHYGIFTQNHTIDIISHCPPEITRC